MDIPTMQQQTKFAQPPEMEAAATGGLIRDAESEFELDLETQESLLLPAGSRGIRLRRRGMAPIVAGVAALGCVAAVLTGHSPVHVTKGGAVSFALGDATSDLQNGAQALDGQAFMYLEPTTVVATLQPGSMLLIDPNNPARTETHKVSVAHADTGAVRFEHGLEHAFPEGTDVQIVTDPAYEADWASASNARMTRYSVPMYLGASGEADSATPDTKVSLNQGCYQFEAGDEVELSSQHGHYEFNMVTGKTPDVIGEDGKCDIHLAYPVKYTHTPTSEVSKMVDRTVGLNPTPAPVTEAPTSAPTAAPPTPVPATPAPPTEAPTAAPTAEPPTAAPTAEPTEPLFDCDAGLDNFMSGWSDDKKDYCCEHQGKGCVAQEATLKDVSGCDTSGDGLITKKESRACDSEVLVRFPELDTDGDGKLNSDEIKDYATLDTDGDGQLCRAEVEGDEFVKGKFDSLDTNNDGCLSQEEMKGEPDIKFLVKEVDFGKLSSDAPELLASLPAELAGVLAGDLDNVEADEVTVELSGGVTERRARRLQSGSLMVSAWVDGDKSSIVDHREQEEEDVHDDLLCSGPHFQELVDCCTTEEPVCGGEASAASMVGKDEKKSGGGGNISLVVGVIGVVALLGLLCCLVYTQACGGAEGARKSEWANDPPNAIVVPGGGLSKDGTLVPWVQERLRRAHQIYQEVNKVKEANGVSNEQNSTYIVTMCEGIRYSPRDPRGNRTLRLESQLSAEFLKNLGVNASDLITDDLSLDTMGNAYFLRTTHTDVFKARSLAVVTNEFHLTRTKAIFERIFQLGPFPDGNQEYTLRFEQVKNQSIEPSALKRRHEWEKQQLQDFEKVSKEWKDLHDVHAYIFSGEETNALPTERREGQLPHSFTNMKIKDANKDNNEVNDNSNNNNTGSSS